VEARVELVDVPPEGLVDAYFGGWYLEDWRLAATAAAGRPYFEAALEGPAALEARFVAGQLVLLLSAVLFIFFDGLMHVPMMIYMIIELIEVV